MPETQALQDIQWLRELLCALVVIPSVNPPGDESAVASLLEGRLLAAGFETRLAAAHPHRPNLIARRNGGGGGPTLLLNGHMDVQPPGTRWTRNPFAAEMEGSTLYGQGAMDMEVTPVMHVTPGEIEPDAPIVKACQAAHRAVTGEEAGIAATAGFEDAHFLLDAGIPTAMFGPYRPAAPPAPESNRSAGVPGRGQADGFFTSSGMADESVDLEDVARAARVYARLIRDLLG